MTNIVIRRCPGNSAIADRTQEIHRVLMADFGLHARVEDGDHDELSIFVDGVPVLSRSENYLPSVEEVEAAIQNADPVELCVASTGTVHHNNDCWLDRPCTEE
jgi:hypothetical protein